MLALLATRAVIDYNYRTAFFWLWLQVVIDATDGALARRARVSERIPWFDGGKLDDIVDYLTYVFVPALFVWRAVLVPDEWTIWIAAAMLLASGYGFSRKDAKTPDHFFTGFPSYWNVVTFYLLVAGWSSYVNAAILVTFVVLVFIPIRYVYPSRTPDPAAVDERPRWCLVCVDVVHALAVSGRLETRDVDLARVSGLLLRVVAVAARAEVERGLTP